MEETTKDLFENVFEFTREISKLAQQIQKEHDRVSQLKVKMATLGVFAEAQTIFMANLTEDGKIKPKEK